MDDKTYEARDGLSDHLEWCQLDQLHKIREGLIARMFAAAVAELSADLEAAPDIPQARVLKLEIRLKPVRDPGTNNLTGVTAEFGVPTTRPKRAATVSLQVKRRIRNGKRGQLFLVFNPLDGQNPDQLAFDFTDPPAG